MMEMETLVTALWLIITFLVFVIIFQKLKLCKCEAELQHLQYRINWNCGNCEHRDDLGV